VDEEEQAPVRIPLGLATTPRNADLTKDALLQNCFIDGSQMGNRYAVKRPGFYVGSEGVTTGLNRGIYVNPNNVTGGSPGEVEIWFVGESGLNSFSYDPDPPVDVFRDYSADLVVGPTAAGSSGAFAYEGTTVSLDDYVRFYYFVNSGDPYIGFGWVLGGIPGEAAEIHTTLNGTYFMEVKLETGNFNLYQDSILISSFANPGFTTWSVPTLQESEQGSEVVINNLQFI